MARRVAGVDVARGVAILAVVLFHLVWDLGDRGLIGLHLSRHAWGKTLGHGIACCFLALVGVSLVLAHRRGIRWPAFWRREAQLVGLAVLVSVASLIYLPDQVITFGILHAIALISVLCIGFVRWPPGWAYGAAVAAVLAPLVVRLPGRDPWVSWTGLTAGSQPTLDWQPVLPWVAVTLVAIPITRTALARRDDRLERRPCGADGGRGSHALQWLGRHTLSIYLLHQPVLVGVLTLVGAGS